MMGLLLITIIVFLVIVGIFLIFIYFKNKSFGSLAGNHIYSDTQQIPGEVLYSDTLKLKGKPDYIIRKGKEYIPVEVKTGKTPHTPYQNHIMQLLAYCVLVEENYSVTPQYGIIKYPEREFSIEFNQKWKESLQELLSQMNDVIKSGLEPHCNHPEHN